MKIRSGCPFDSLKPAKRTPLFPVYATAGSSLKEVSNILRQDGSQFRVSLQFFELLKRTPLFPFHGVVGPSLKHVSRHPRETKGREGVLSCWRCSSSAQGFYRLGKVHGSWGIMRLLKERNQGVVSEKPEFKAWGAGEPEGLLNGLNIDLSLLRVTGTIFLEGLV